MIRRPPRFTLFPCSSLFLFFFNDTATTEIYTLSLHDALPICRVAVHMLEQVQRGLVAPVEGVHVAGLGLEGVHGLQLLGQLLQLAQPRGDRKSTRLNSSHTVISYAVFCLRTKENTSEIQSHSDLVCRLLLEQKRGPRTTFRDKSE